MATGCLSVPTNPTFPGLESFDGATYHTGRWPHEGVDFTGQRVGVIGTGSSAIQSIPLIAEQAEHLTVFQRTPNFSMPALNAPLDPDAVAEGKADYDTSRANRHAGRSACSTPATEQSPLAATPTSASASSRRWERGGLPFIGAYADLLIDKEANETAAEFVRRRDPRDRRRPRVAERCAPDLPFGCKRLCVDTGYYETFNRRTSRSSTSRDADRASHAHGVRTRRHEHEVDAIVFATGFDAMTGALLAIDIRGRGRASLSEKWADGPRTYLGLATAGFPNLFTITGPGSPSVLTNMILSIEQHVDWIADCIAHMRAGTPRSSPEAAEDELGRPRRRGRRLARCSPCRLVVPRRQRARQAARVHALSRWRRRVPKKKKKKKKREEKKLREEYGGQGTTASSGPTSRRSRRSPSWPATSRSTPTAPMSPSTASV